MSDLGEDARDELTDGNFPEWLGEAYGDSGMGIEGFALFVLFGGAIGLYNWTESFKVPAVWVVLMAPVVAIALPVPVVWRLMGFVTVALAMLFIGMWIYWQRM